VMLESPVPPLAIAATPVMLPAVPVMLMPCVFVHVLVSARSVVEATMMFAEPLKETPLMVRAVSRVVAVPALPVMLREMAEDVETEARVLTPVA